MLGFPATSLRVDQCELVGRTSLTLVERLGHGARARRQRHRLLGDKRYTTGSVKCRTTRRMVGIVAP
jgi:hypothetical protein